MPMQKIKVRVSKKFVHLEGRMLTAVIHAIRTEDKEGDEDRPQSLVIQYHHSAFETDSSNLTETAEAIVLLSEGCEYVMSVHYDEQKRIGSTRHLYRLMEVLTAPRTVSR